MTRRLIATVVLCAVALMLSTATSRFVAWGDEVSTAVGTLLAYVAPPAPASTDGGIDFIECMGCDSLPGPEGIGIGMLALLLAGGPLAFAAAVCERRQQQFGGAAIPSVWCQTGFVLQAASVAVGVLFLAALVTFAMLAEAVLHWSSAAGFVNVLFGVPALFTWRRLQAEAFAAPRRPLIKAA